MSNKIATHSVRCYWNYAYSKLPLNTSEKYNLLKRGVRSLLDTGRVPLSVQYDEGFLPERDLYRGLYIFDVVYLGRKTVHQVGVRHRFREKHKEFMRQPITIDRRQYAETQ